MKQIIYNVATYLSDLYLGHALLRRRLEYLQLHLLALVLEEAELAVWSQTVLDPRQLTLHVSPHPERGLREVY